jgi:lysophospholipase L1-like esterase
MPNNYLGQALGLTALVAAFLVVVSAVSTDFSVAGVDFRRMDIFADIRTQRPATTTESDSLTTLPADTTQHDLVAADSLVRGPMPLADSSQFGQNFEDYSFDGRGLSRFFAAIDSVRNHGRKVRVAFFGDSFVEGDILLGDLRDTLQSVWGGAGVGFVPMDSEISRFRRTFLQQHIRGWKTYSIIHNDGNAVPLGINGHVYLPAPDAQVRYDGTRQYGFSHTQAWGEVRLFYRGAEGVNFVWQIEGEGPTDAPLPATAGLVGVWKHDRGQANIGGFAFRFPQVGGGLAVYGASLESGPGVYFDNFSTRGNSGGKLRLIRPEVVQAFDRYQHYDLVVLQYGLNAAGNSTRNIGWYRAELDKTYEHIRQCFPHTPVLVVGVPDRAGNLDGQLQTLPSVLAITAMQRDLARKHGFLFFDFYHFMGGSGSMVALADSRSPTLANRDYTHLTHEGGRVMGRRWAQVWLAEYARRAQF